MTTAQTHHQNPQQADNALEHPMDKKHENADQHTANNNLEQGVNPKSAASVEDKKTANTNVKNADTKDDDFKNSDFEDSDLKDSDLKDKSTTATNNRIEQHSDRMIFTTDTGKRYEFYAPSAHDLLGINYADLFGGETQALMTFLTKLCPEFTQKTARHLSFKDIIQLIAGANIFLGKQLDSPSM